MKANTLAVLGSLLVVVWAFGCSSGGDAASGEQGVTQADCEAYVAAYCDRTHRCQPRSFRMDYADVAACRQREAVKCPALSAPGVGWTHAKVQACAAATQANDCYTSTNSACDPGPGTLPNGSGCLSDKQCSTNYCDHGALDAGYSRCGTCAPTSSVGLNAPCGGANYGLCPSGQSCRQQAASGQPDDMQCVTQSAEGAACSSAHPCAAGLACLADCSSGIGGLCTTGATTCRRSGGPGAACTPALDLDANVSGLDSCDFTKDLQCTGSGSTCTTVASLQPGQTCDGYTNGVCVGGARCLGSVCVAAAADGATCNLYSGPPCMPHASCTAGVCTLPVSDYAACSN
jgi:hypothetical protein